MRLEINYKEKTAKNTDSWKLNNMIVNNQWIIEEIKEEIKRYIKTMTMKIQQSKTYGTQKKQF